MFTLEVRGIRCRVSPPLMGQIGWDASHDLVEHFFEHEPPEGLRWVGHDEMTDPTKGEDELPMYTVSNGNIDVLIWPLLDPKDNKPVLCLQLREERPNLDSELVW